jgi:putative hydrolase of the HAD superfamily
LSVHPVRAVLFDLWGTLVYNIPRATNFHEVISACGVSPELLWKTWREYNEASLRGHIRSGEERARLVLQKLERPPEVIEYATPLLAEFERQNRTAEVHFYPGVEDMLVKLRQMGLKVGLVSNSNYVTPPVVERLDLRRKLDLTILSCEVGMAKPQVEIFLMAAQRLKVETHQCLFVGDGGDREMEGAKLAGCTTALVEQERGHAFRNPNKDFAVDYRLPIVTAVLEYVHPLAS